MTMENRRMVDSVISALYRSKLPVNQPMEPIVSRSAPPAMLPSAVPARQVTQEKNAI